MSLFSMAFLIFSSFLQTTEGQLTITLLDSQQQAAANESISLMTETDELLGSCVTDLTGRCTINVSAPSDSSGLIRGTLIISERGTRAVLWPGGPLTVQLMLDENGQLPQIVDVLATRVKTATPEPSRTAEPSQTAEPVATESAETESKRPEPTVFAIAPAATVPIDATATTVLEERGSVTGHNWWSFGLIIILLAALLLYIWSTFRRRQL